MVKVFGRRVIMGPGGWPAWTELVYREAEVSCLPSTLRPYSRPLCPPYATLHSPESRVPAAAPPSPRPQASLRNLLLGTSCEELGSRVLDPIRLGFRSPAGAGKGCFHCEAGADQSGRSCCLRLVSGSQDAVPSPPSPPLPLSATQTPRVVILSGAPKRLCQGAGRDCLLRAERTFPQALNPCPPLACPWGPLAPIPAGTPSAGVK